MNFTYEYMTLTQLGQIFGATSHRVGKWLVKIGLRTQAKRPSKAAFEGKYVKAGPSRGEGYNWIWHSDRTTKTLADAGHQIIVSPNSDLIKTPRLVGPFEVRSNPRCGFEVVSGDGSVAVIDVGEQNADLVCQLLNLAHGRGVIARLLNNDVDTGIIQTQEDMAETPPE